jgi:hypothetical protein
MPVRAIQEFGVAPLDQRMPGSAPAYTAYWPEVYPRVLRDATQEHVSLALGHELRAHGRFMADVQESIILDGNSGTRGEYPTVRDSEGDITRILSTWDRGLGNFNGLQGAAPDLLRAAGLLMGRNVVTARGRSGAERVQESHSDDVFRSFNNFLASNPVEDQRVSRSLYLAGSFVHKAALLEPVPTRQGRLLRVASSVYDRAYNQPRALSDRERLEAGEFLADVRFKLAMNGLRQAREQNDVGAHKAAFVGMRVIMKERSAALRSAINIAQKSRGATKRDTTTEENNDAAGFIFEQFVSLAARDKALASIYMGDTEVVEVRKAYHHEDYSPRFSLRLPRNPSFDLVATETDEQGAITARPLQLKFGRDFAPEAVRERERAYRRGGQRPQVDPEQRANEAYLPGIIVVRAKGLLITHMDAMAQQLGEDYRNPTDLKPSRGMQQADARRIQQEVLAA